MSFLSIFHLTAIARTSIQDGGITLELTDVPLSEALSAIEDQSRYLFVNRGVDLSATVSINVSGVSIDEACKRLLEPLAIRYDIQRSSIIIENLPVPEPVRVSGTIIDASGFPVPGAAVLEHGTVNGTVTDLDGNFSLTVSSPDAVLEVNCLGYDVQTVQVGTRTVFNLTLNEAAVALEGTVVTALGIRRSEKALSYNVQEVKSEALLSNKDANFVNSLNGKVAGLVINASSSGVGGASKVVMRGQKSISKSSNALYVIDGVPMYTSARDAGTEFDSRGATDPIADLNPEDIESMTVLTGAAAAALYGSAAANGAIVITTKKGEEGKTTVTVTSNTEIFSPFVLPRFQNRYGTGDYSSSEGSAVRSWGKKLNKANMMGYDPRKDYFRTGVTGTESVALSTGNSRNQTYLSAAAVNSIGNVPNNSYDRYNFTFRNTTKFFGDRMTLDVSASYILQNDRNMTNQGTYNNPLTGAYLFPRGNDWNDIYMFERWDPARLIHTQYWPVGDAGMTMQNPYWINYRNLRENRKTRYMLSAGLSYEILDWLTLSGRVRIDNSHNRFTEKFYATTNTQLTEASDNGLFGEEISEDRQVYADVLIDITRTWGRWSLHANAGASITDMKNDMFASRGPIAADNIPNVFNIFAVDQSAMVKKQAGWREQTQSVYASAEIGYRNAVYLTLTGRNDWPSQLAGPRSTRSSFFYPSAGASVVLSELIPDMPDYLEYIKVRASYASVGSSFERWLANPVHEWPDKGNAWATDTLYPVNLLPERTQSWEAGLTMRFLRWFSLDATYYNTHTKNQTFFPEISTGSGYSSIPIQSGDVLNEGFELALGFEKEWGIFGWSSSYTFSTNRNRIESLAENAVNPVTGEKLNITSLNMGGLGNARFILREGGSLGDLYSRSDMMRDDDGGIFVGKDGEVVPMTIENVDDYIKLGSVLPKANMAWRNDFRIGNFNVGFMITGRFGGVVFSRTQAVLDYYGVSEATAVARDNGGIIINGSDVVDANTWYSAAAGGDVIPQLYTYSATNVRLQEASVGYTFPRSMLGDVCELTLQLVGRNLLMIWNKAPFDPEAIATTGNYYQGIDYFMMPSTRNFGFNVRLKF